MAISTEIVGKTFGPFVRDYTFKDLEICALGCGAGWDGHVDLDYVNEGDAKNPELKVLPIIDAAVVRIHRAQMRTVGRVGLAYLFGKRSASLATIPNGFLGYIGLNVVGHLERRMKMNVDAVMQRSGIIKTVIERGGHFLVNRKRHCEDG